MHLAGADRRAATPKGEKVMLYTSKWRKSLGGTCGRFMLMVLIVLCVGMANSPAVASVSVDQSPLTTQLTLPPNITLLVDDSGSMNWDYMPDVNYLCNTARNNWSSCSSSGYMSNNYLIDIERSSSLNGAYYNPNQSYALPVRADGSSYPTPTFPMGYVNPYSSFASANSSSDSSATASTVDITDYNNYGASGSGLETRMGPSADNGLFNYFTQFSQTVTNTLTAAATLSCPSNYTYNTSTGQCVKNSNHNSTQSPTHTCPSGYSYQSSGTYSGQCTEVVTTINTANLFTYELPVGSAGAITGYNFYYVAKSASDCAIAENGIVVTSGNGVTGNNGLGNNASGFSTSYGSTPPIPTTTISSVATTAPTPSSCIVDPTVQQNVADWFSYYRTRVMMAKAGIMSAFSTLNGSFRVGFASIDNGNAGSGSSIYNRTDYNALTNAVGSANTTKETVGSYFVYLANVAPFNYTDPTSGTTTTVNGNTQKVNMWSWAAALSPGGGTPTVSALAAIGQYYGTDAPTAGTASAWASMASDPNYSSSNQTTYLGCRASYTILTTDGFWNVSYGGSTVTTNYASSKVSQTGANGASYSLAANTPPFAEGYGTNGSGATVSTSNTPSEVTLADVADYYWATDLQPNVTNEVPTNTADPAFWQHMTTFTMGLGFPPVTITPSSASANNASSVFSWSQQTTGSAIANFSWGAAASSSGGIENIADLAHAGVSGRGGYYSITNPSDFQAGLTDALARAAQRLGSGASLAANSTQLTSGTDAFQATYYTGTWMGDLKEYSVDPNTGAIGQTPAWDAASLLPPNTATTTATPQTAASRVIYTHNASDSATSGYTNFVVSSTGTPPALSSTQLANLGSTTVAQANMVNYLRGDASNEQRKGGAYRDRTTTVLGDIVDSQPIYESGPNANEFYGQTFLGSSSYANFVTNEANREAVVWVAANDGMLHAFDAITGLEVYAYLPGAVLSDTTNPISNLANSSYGTGTTVPHAYFNDGILTIADAYDGTNWHTVLVGTTGRGTAKAVYALDVTNPQSVSFLWERSAGDGVDSNSLYIGQITGQPVIAQTGSAAGEWSVLVGNGYNSPNGAAALLQFNLFTGALTVHTTTDTGTTNYNVTSNMSTDTTANNFTLTTSTTSTTGNGLAAPAVWEDSATNGISTKAWAGDLNGAVWQFTLNNIDSNGGTDDTTPSSSGTQVFQATDASGNVQPITGGMLAGEDPNTGNVWLFFGTGRYLTSTDWSNLAGQTWYGVIAENNSGTPLTCSTATSGSGCGVRSALVQRQIIYEQAATSSESAARVITTSDTATPVNDTASGGQNYQGWYIDLLEPQPNTSGPDSGDLADQQGERIVTPNQFEGNLLLATTRLPLASDPCNPSGSGWVMAVSPFSGTNPSTEFFDLNGDGVVNSSDTVNVNGKSEPAGGIGFSSLPNNPIFTGTSMMVSFNNGSNGSFATSGASGSVTRVSWRELINQ